VPTTAPGWPGSAASAHRHQHCEIWRARRWTCSAASPAMNRLGMVNAPTLERIQQMTGLSDPRSNWSGLKRLRSPTTLTGQISYTNDLTDPASHSVTIGEAVAGIMQCATWAAVAHLTRGQGCDYAGRSVRRPNGYLGSLDGTDGGRRCGRHNRRAGEVVGPGRAIRGGVRRRRSPRANRTMSQPARAASGTPTAATATGRPRGPGSGADGAPAGVLPALRQRHRA
jgi:hypothetical protein